jgi:hypothetical protein
MMTIQLKSRRGLELNGLPRNISAELKKLQKDRLNFIKRVID